MAKFTDLVDIPLDVNAGLVQAGNHAMLSILGNPRSSYSTDCQPVTNAALKNRIVTASVGPFKVRGLDSAVDSLKSVLADVKSLRPEVYAVLGTAGMLCARLIRGSRTGISNHSWGTAIDLTIGGQLCPLGKAKCQRGLALIAPIFKQAGWYWGAGFSRPDSMHFEASRALVISWAKGVPTSVLPLTDDLNVGDRSPAVLALQKALNKRGEKLDLDGIFGANTRNAVIAFQAKVGVKTDGVVGTSTRKALEA